MGLIRLAMGRPVTIIVIVASFVLFSMVAMTRMKIDIFPQINLPRVTVIQPYGGMDPAQMEGYMVTFYEQHFFYISGVDHVSSKTIQGASVMDVYFRPEADMSDAMAQVVAQVERSRAYMPPGTVTPFILRYDVGNVPVGYLVFSSPTRNLGEIQDLVYSRIRPIVSTTPGVSTPPPFGGNQRSIVITVDATRLSQYHLSIDDIVKSINDGNTIMPSGVVRTGDLQRMSKVNSVVTDIQELGQIPIKGTVGAAVYLRDIAKVEDTTDILTGYALVNGRRTIYMAISKQSSASTLSVVDGVKKNIPYMQSLLPEDIKVSFDFDQSVYVTEALSGLLMEGGIGAILTGAVVLIFLQDFKSSIIVIMNIPFALLIALVGLWLSGQSINIMTLSGLSLAVGILVDEATVTIENIHSHLANGTELKRAIYDASVEVVVPRLLAMLSVVSVFTPSFFMVGATQSLFVPLSLAVGLAMFASYLLSGTFVPVMSAWMLKSHPPAEGGHGGEHNTAGGNNGNNGSAHKPSHNEEKGLMGRVRTGYQRLLIRLMPFRVISIIIFALAGLTTFAIYPMLGSEIFPAGNPKGFQLRLKAPTGTRFEITEVLAKKALKIIADDVGPDNVEVSVGYVGVQPPSYAVSCAYMWTSGPQEAILMVSFKDEAKVQIKALEEKLRKQFKEQLDNVDVTFEAGDIVNKVMNFGSPTPLQVDVDGPNFEKDEEYAARLTDAMSKISYLRDVTVIQPLDYPTLNVKVDRVRAGQLDVTMRDVGKALIAATYSSRFVTPIYWADPKSGLSYQVQVEVPQGDINSLRTVGSIPIKTGSFSGPFVRDVANINYGSMPGEYDHYNMRRMISISANLSGDDLGQASRLVEKAIKDLGSPPRGVKVTVRGQVPTMKETFNSLIMGVGFAIIAIFLLLVGFFQSVQLSLIIISVIPAIMFGAITALALTNTTVNVQSFMGAIMAIGVGVANSILVVVFAEERRMLGISAKSAAITGAAARLRPVLMTSIAMIAGMVPMALGMSEGGDRTAPLGRAVIGGLLVSTTAVLLILPQIYALVQRKASRRGASVLPDEPSVHYESPVVMGVDK
ncbi:MAG: efflux RND transporter permease subunit [Cyanobacteria bacterium REEB67]|nr:efflux RND transporter permease subunit [Cyanobacteria bacterium REEB67]